MGEKGETKPHVVRVKCTMEAFIEVDAKDGHEAQRIVSGMKDLGSLDYAYDSESFDCGRSIGLGFDSSIHPGIGMKRKLEMLKEPQ